MAKGRRFDPLVRNLLREQYSEQWSASRSAELAFLASRDFRRKMGRHAHYHEVEWQIMKDFVCYMKLKELVSGGMEWYDAEMQIAEELGLSERTVIRGYVAAKKREANKKPTS